MSVPWGTSSRRLKNCSVMPDSAADRITGNRATALGAGLLLLLYPLLIFVGLRHFEARWLALILVVVAATRLFLYRRHAGTTGGTGTINQATATVPLLAAVLCATVFTLTTGSSWGLLLYPVMVNAVLLMIFVASLWRPPSFIETLARLQEPDLPPRGVRYTRKVTLAWAVFFAVNGVMALTTAFLDPYWWALYNGLIAYLLMGVLMGAEWLVRRRVRGAHRG